MKFNNSLLKIMIVDDEELSRTFLETCIDWESYHAEIVFSAVSAMEALTFIEDEQMIPDIIFTDIKMPYMNGLELSQIILKQYPNIKIIILTAHKDFDYAQKSVHLGITGFLLKPISPITLVEALTKAITQIEEDRKRWNELDHLKSMIHDNYDYLREQFILRMMNSSSIDSLDQHQFAYYYPSGIPAYCQVTLLEIASDGIPVSEEESLLNDLKMLDYVKNHIASIENLDYMDDHNHHIALIAYSSSIKFEKICEQIQYSIEHLSGLQVSFGIGKAYNNIQSLTFSYKEALESLKFCRFAVDQNIIVYENDINICSENEMYHPFISDDLKLGIKTGLVDEVPQAITLLYKNANGEYISVTNARLLSMTLLSVAISITNEVGISLSSQLTEDIISFLSLLQKESVSGLMHGTLNYIDRLTRDIAAHRSNLRNNSLWEIIGFVQKNYVHPEISLSMVSEKFHMNDSYLSRIFKKELGFSFSKYVNRLRMDQAIELLNSTDLKVYQIAEAVGIPDAYYFSNCFKKYTGKSVRDYKKDYSSI